ncbi:MAG TPA: DUF2911 domain-containing protein [Flavitalea sp.]|nr:DUF2911 domain-containing protein [Flavitalea sp.]
MEKLCWPFLLLALCLSCNNGAPSAASAGIPNQPRIPETADPPVDKSVMDMSYFPPEYPQLKMAGKAKGGPVIRVIYSRPHKAQRKILGEVVQVNEPWRLGANEATEIEFFRDVTILNKRVPAGRYILYAIPGEDKWQLILNGDLFTWGLHIDKSKDLYSFPVPVRRTSVPMEVFSIQFGKTAKGCELTIAWDTMLVSLPIDF